MLFEWLAKLLAFVEPRNDGVPSIRWSSMIKHHKTKHHENPFLAFRVVKSPPNQPAKNHAPFVWKGGQQGSISTAWVSNQEGLGDTHSGPFVPGPGCGRHFEKNIPMALWLLRFPEESYVYIITSNHILPIAIIYIYIHILILWYYPILKWWILVICYGQ